METQRQEGSLRPGRHGGRSTCPLLSVSEIPVRPSGGNGVSAVPKAPHGGCYPCTTRPVVHPAVRPVVHSAHGHRVPLQREAWTRVFHTRCDQTSRGGSVGFVPGPGGHRGVGRVGVSGLSRAASPWGAQWGSGCLCPVEPRPRPPACAGPENRALREGARGAWRLGARVLVLVAFATVRAMGTGTPVGPQSGQHSGLSAWCGLDT